jgi:hypothetical protein
VYLLDFKPNHDVLPMSGGERHNFILQQSVADLDETPDERLAGPRCVTPSYREGAVRSAG